MKYIRTKDGRIYDLESKEVSSWEYINEELANNVYREKEAFYCIYYYDENKAPYLETDGKGGHSMDSIGESEILKQADTIEKLCDEFHIEYFSLDKKLSYVRFYDFEIAKQNNEDNDEIYGAIHIKGKGLIYVAKMNDKGELELL